MATNKFLVPLGLIPEKYTAWKKEMKFLKMAKNVNIMKRAQKLNSLCVELHEDVLSIIVIVIGNEISNISLNLG